MTEICDVIAYLAVGMAFALALRKMDLCNHKWLPWSDPIRTYEGGHKQQWRCCATCNKAQFRTMWWDKQSTIGDVGVALQSSRSKACE